MFGTLKYKWKHWKFIYKEGAKKKKHTKLVHILRKEKPILKL